ncbi:DUF3857 domain-containing protein [Psychroserpens sp. AS72]|uniref:DUF3857 domain-containing protein n=1 Tax=Psychroserpens sp. AS72 TaxID=3135775 RepID=UPI00316CA706
MKVTILVFILLFTLNSKAQDFKFGKVSKTELTESFNPKDSSANAAVLYKKVDIRFEFSQSEGFRQIREVHERIKIYNKEGYKWATKRIRLYNESNSKSEDLKSLKGYTYNLIDGEIEDFKLKKDGVFKEEVNKYWKISSFTMPNINDGSVIEYTYEISSPFSAIDDIEYQYTIPINVFDLSIKTPEYFFYNKLVNPKASYIPRINQSKRNRTERTTDKNRSGLYVSKTTYSHSEFTFVENVITSNETNIPALKDEPFVDNLDNYKTKLILELSEIRYPNQPVESLSSSWDAVTKTIYNNSEFGNQLDRTNYFKDDIDAIIAGIDDPAQKAFLIFNFVKTKVKWNEFYGYSSDIGVRKAYKEGVGNVADINLMLISMLRYVGIKADPVLVSTKNNGIPLFPTRQGFNYIVCFMEGDGFSALLDATEPFSEFNVLPGRVLNWQGRLIMENGNSKWIDLTPSLLSDEATYINVKINSNLSIEGKVRNLKSDYKAKQFRNRFANVNSDEYIKYLEKDKGELLVSDLEIENAKNTNQPVKVVYSFELSNEVEEVGENVYFTPLIFLATKENPFKSETRNYPIDLSFPFNDKYVVNIMIPEGYKVESLPKSKKIEFNVDQGEFTYLVNESGNFIRLNVSFLMNTSLVYPKDYEEFKKFYLSMIETQTEKIVLKKI